MKLTTKSEYSLLALIFIARRQKKGFVTIAEICEKLKISKKYLEQLFSVLERSRYLKARRGSGGGYALARPAGKITVAEIVRLMDGALAPTGSVSEYFFAHTPIEKEKKVLKLLKDIRDFTARLLEKATLKDLI